MWSAAAIRRRPTTFSVNLRPGLGVICRPCWRHAAGAAQCIKFPTTTRSARGISCPCISTDQAVPNAAQPAGQGVSGAAEAFTHAAKRRTRATLICSGTHVEGPSCRHAGVSHCQPSVASDLAFMLYSLHHQVLDTFCRRTAVRKLACFVVLLCQHVTAAGQAEALRTACNPTQHVAALTGWAQSQHARRWHIGVDLNG